MKRLCSNFKAEKILYQIFHGHHQDPLYLGASVSMEGWKYGTSSFQCMTRQHNENRLDPAILHSVLDRKLTCIEFSANSPVVLVGDDNGAVNVYRHNLGGEIDTEGKELGEILEKNMATSAAAAATA